MFIYGQKPFRSDYFIKANLPVNMDVFSGKLAFWHKKKGQNDLTEIKIFQQPLIGWRSRPYKSITEHDYLHFFGTKL